MPNVFPAFVLHKQDLFAMRFYHTAQADAADTSCNNPLKPCQKSTQQLTFPSLTLACLTSQHLLRV